MGLVTIICICGYEVKLIKFKSYCKTVINGWKKINGHNLKRINAPSMVKTYMESITQIT